jgi:hypothetical protein
MNESRADRIEQALARIEAAASARAYSGARMRRRHALLRTHMEEAVSALDAVIAEQAASEEPE